MSTWNAINVEPEEDASPEIDDTKEIQLEEAFRLYQNALRLHSLGPSYHDEAADAYDELFRSDVFKYPEAASEFDQDQVDEITPITPVAPDLAIVPAITVGAVDNANSLTQLVYLAYKNRAQFEIDSAHALCAYLSDDSRSALIKHYGEACKQSLINSAVALERDDTDLDLWKRASRVSDALQSVRLVRFCLESVLAGDDEGEEAIDLSGLEEAFAKEELRATLAIVEDDLSKTRTSDVQPKVSLLSILKQSNDPYPFLPTKPKALEYVDSAKRPQHFVPKHERVTLNAATHLAIADSFVRCLSAQHADQTSAGMGTCITFDLSQADTVEDKDLMLDTTISPVQDKQLPLSDQPSRADGQAANPNGEVDSPASFHSVREGADDASHSPRDVDMGHPKGSALPEGESPRDDPGSLQAHLDTVTLPSRKRSSTAAGNEEPEARSRSKRIKARESMVVTVAQEDEVSHDPASIPRDHFLNIEAADDALFKTVNDILEKAGVQGFGPLEQFRSRLDGAFDEPNVSTAEAAPAPPPETIAMGDLRQALGSWNEEKNSAFIAGHGGRDHVEKATGLSLFLKHSKPNHATEPVLPMAERSSRVKHFIQAVNDSSISIAESLYQWLLELLTHSLTDSNASPYLQGLWPPELKNAVVEILVSADECIASCFRQFVLRLKNSQATKGLEATTQSDPMWRAAELAQSVFELHLDIYVDITSPASALDAAVREAQQRRLQQWAQTATDMMHLAGEMLDNNEGHRKEIVLRYLWASVTFAKLSDSVDKSHILICLAGLEDVLQQSGIKDISLPNNSAMPVISSPAVEQEISKVKTLEFFMSVFDSDNSDPEAVILKLEPILEHQDLSHLSDTEQDQLEDFRSFLSAGDASLTLFLWKRLQNAYTAISYNTKVVSCLLRSVETIVQQILSKPESGVDGLDCALALLRSLRDADDLITRTLGKISDDKAAFEAIDEPHLRSSMSAVVGLIRIVYSFVVFDDQLRVGDISPPSFRNATASKNFEKTRDRFREMHVRLWTLLYWIVKESTVQMAETFANAELDLVLFIRCVHAALGERQYCKHCNKLFVRLAKAELFSFNTSEDLSLDIAQVIYDLYQIKLSAGYGDSDHGCSAEAIERDKRMAQTLVPIIMDYVKRLNVKDLMRSELKATIDRIQNALGQPKPSTAVSFNRRAVSAYLKSVINPQRVYQALRGIGELELKTVSTNTSNVAEQGWYLLLGNLTLTKYRSVKRVNPTPTDDLDNAMAYLRQDIEHGATSWESWYRLAQVHDAKIEDSLIWNSNKLNDNRAELATMERNAINAYTMAIAIALRTANDDVCTKKLLDDMFFEFSTRLYSSSRPPLDMEAFSTKKAVRHLSDHHSQAMSEEPLVKPMSEYGVWKMATYLIRASTSGDSRQWTRYYMLGKCLWKMFNSTANTKTHNPVTVEDVVEAFKEAVDRVPKKERSSDPILEPHFKLVSTVHKLRNTKAIPVSKAVEYLQTTPYARGFEVIEDDKGNPKWGDYIVAILKKLQNADKSGWHHRITARAAHVLYDHDRSIGAATKAKNQFSDSIFTKNMTMQVWKPENERAGRHYIYTGRYLRFFVEILDTLRDRSNLEQVVRKIRRKTTDFINHTKVWEDAVTTYIELLRRIGNIPRGRERALFDNISFDEFTRQSEKLEKWAHEPDTTTTFLDIIKDAIEMKKLNNSLMKGSAIDDLIGDAYACMYDLYVSQLPPEDQTTQPQATLPQGTFFNLTSTSAPSGDDNLDRMRLNNLLSGQTDGADGIAPETAPNPAGLGIGVSGATAVGTPPPDVVRAPAPAKPGRAKTITKREVQKKAEGAIGKPPPIKTPTLTKRSISINVPSTQQIMSQSRQEEDDRSDMGDENVASGMNSRHGSASRRNSPDAEARDDEGGDGDNEEDQEDENEDEGTDTEATTTRKRLFPGLAPPDTKYDDEEEDGNDEGAEEEEEEEHNSDEEEAMSDVKAEDEDGDDRPEIPDSQEPIGKQAQDRNGMNTD